jgi:protocatechuate 3,4-dioxygenase beta subunit
MACVKHLFDFTVFFAIALVAPSWFVTNAQTPDPKPKATASITGRVTIGEKPAPGVIVAAATATFPQTLLAQTVSDGEGKYRMTGLIPGPITVSAVAPTYVMPASPMPMPGRILNLSADEAVEGIDFKLTRGGVITGRATDADGKPVMEERVTLTQIDEKGEPLRSLQPYRAANPSSYSTDDRGIYRIFGLSAGRYKVSVGDSGGGAVLRSGYYQKTYHPDTTEVAKAAIVELGEGGEARNIDITLAPRARTYTVSGRVIDGDTGEPIPGVTYAFGQLQQFQAQTMMAGYASPGTLTNAKGEFRLEGVAPGRYAVTTVRNSFGLDSNQPKVYSDPVPFEVIDGDISDVEVKAHHGLTISGVVVTDGIANKAAAAGVSRLIVSGVTMAPPSTIQTSSGFTTGRIAADGSFQLEGLQPGKVRMSISGFSAAESRGYTISRIVLADRDVPNRQIELAAGQNVSGVRIYLQFGTGVLKGDVKITGTLPPDAIMFVSLQTGNQPGPVASAQVDSRGHFIVSGIPAGSYDATLQVLPMGPGFGTSVPKPLHQSVTVTDDSESQISFTLDLTRKEGP